MTTETTTHTPGPWYVKSRGGSIPDIIDDSEGHHLATVEKFHYGNPLAVGNARLIAEAPNLIEALREWKCPGCGGSGIYHQEWSRAHPFPVTGTCRKCNGDGLHPTASAAIAQALGVDSKP